MKKRFTFILTLTALLCLGTGNVWGEELTVHNGTSTTLYAPLYGYYGDQFIHTQIIYPAESAMSGGDITSMTFYMSSKGSKALTSEFQIRLCEVADATFSSTSWKDVSDATLVYEGTLDCYTTTTMTITFQNAYSYNGGNLLFDLQSKTKGSYTSSSTPSFLGENVNGVTYNFLYNHNGTSIASMTTGTAGYKLPKVTFTYDAASSCKKPSALTPGEITTTSATFSWTAGASETSWQYICLPAATAVDWNSVNVQTTSTPSASVSGLSANTNYKFYVRADCGSEQSADLVKAFTTACGAISVFPYTLGFETSEGVSAETLPSCWGKVSATSSPAVIANTAYTTYAHTGGTQALRFNGSGEQYVVLPLFEQEVKNLTISFWYKNYYYSWYPSDIVLGSMTDPTDKTTFTVIKVLNSADDYSNILEESLASAPSGDYYIAFKYTASDSYAAVYLDDVTVARASSCTKPTDLTASASSPTSANVSWTAGGSETAWNLQYRTGSGAWTAVNNISSNPYTLIGLNSSTTYEIQVQANCGGEQSGWTSSVEVHTPCAAVTSFPWTEDFTGMEEYITPECWDNSASTTTTIGTYPYYVWGTIEKSSNMMLQLYNRMVQSGTAVINTPLFTLPNANDFQFLFDYSHRANCGAFKVKMSVDGSPFADLGTYTNEAGTTATYPGEFTTVTIDLSSYNLANKTIQFQFFANANYSSGGIYIDNIKVRKAPTCITPSGLTISGVTSASANLSWTAGAGETNWKVQYKADGAGSWTDKAVSGTPSCTLSGLSASTTYYVQVIADCGSGDYSEPTAQSSFATTCAAEAMPYEESFSSNTMPACWEMTAPNTTNKWYMDYQYSSGAYNYYIRLRTGLSGTATLQLPPIALTEDAVLKFQWKSASSPVAPVSLYISTDGGTTKTEIPNNLSTSHSDWTEKTYDLSSYTGNTVLIYFISTFSSANKYAYLDDIQVIAKPCDLLTNVNAVPTVDGGTISWTGDAKKLQYRAGTSGAWTSVTIADANKANPHTLTGLASGTAYQVRVLSICGDESDESDWTAPVSFTTRCAPSSVLPYENNFESESEGFMPDCWTKVTTSDDYPQVVNGAWAYGGSGNYLEFRGTEDQIAVLPAFTAPLNTLTVQFFYRNHYADFQFGYVKADGATFVALETLTQDASYGENPHEIDLASIPAEAVCLAFCQTNASSLSAAACVDNLVVKETPTCVKPVSLAFSAVTSVGATFTWSASAKGETQYQYCVVAKDAAPSGWTLLGENVRTVTIDDKAAHTEYDFHVRSYCGSSDQSESAKISFQTACAVISALPWEHDFESDVTWDAPECWDAIDNSGNSYVFGSNGHNAAKSLFVETGRTTNQQTVILPKFSTALGGLYISFWYKGSEDTSTKTYGKVQVGYMTDATDESTFVPVGDPFAPTGSYQNAEVQFAGVSADARIALRYTGGTSDGELYIDDIRVAVASSCVRPTEVNAVAVSGGANITWTDDAASEWSLRYSVKDADSWTEVNSISATNYLLSGLTNGTNYEVQVKAVCGVGDESDWSESAFFTPVCNAPTALVVTARTQNSATFSWTGVESAWKLQYKADADADWTEVNVSANPFTLTGLTAGTNYQAKIQSACGSAFTDAVSFTTWCGMQDAADLPINITGFSAVPECWEAILKGEWSGIYDPQFCFYGTEEQWLVLPMYDINLNKLSITCEFAINGPTPEFGYLDEPNGTFHPFSTALTSGVELDLSGEAEAPKYIAIRYPGGATSLAFVKINSLSVRRTPGCAKLDAPTAVPGVGSATISWTAGSESAWNLQYRLASGGLWTNATGVISSPFELTGLEQGTSYKVRVQADCGGGDLGDWSNETTFTTSCDAIAAIPFTEDFNTELSNCWDITDENTNTYPHSVFSDELRLPGGKAASGHLVKLPEITASLANATMTITYKSTTGANTAVPQVGYMDGLNFTELAALEKTNSFKTAYVSLAAADGHRLALRYDDGTSEGDFDIDEIRVSRVEIFYDAADAENETRLEALKSAGPIDAVFERPVLRNGDYNTLCLPFDLSAAQLADDKCPLNGFEVKEYDHTDIDLGADQVDIFLRTVGTIEAGKACFVRLVEGTLDRLAMADFRDVTIKTSTITPTDDNASGIHYIGIFDPHDLIGKSSANLYLSTDNALYIPANDTKMKGFRAYFGVDAGGPASAPIRRGAQVRIVEHKDSATGVENVQNDKVQSTKILEGTQIIIIRNGVRYTIHGQKMN